jgi:hypothetical protein
VLRSSRINIAKLLLVIYFAITMSPLAPFALHSAVVAHAVTGECTGDCAICGCAPERSATHSCCCWQKKLQGQQSEDQEEVESCCKKKKKPASAPVASYKSSPCGSGKLIALWGGEFFECYLNSNDTDPLILNKATLVPSPYHNRTGRSVAPPDPPPKLCILS